MEKKHLIGKKVRGFEFKATDSGLFFVDEMTKYNGRIGTTLEIVEDDVRVEFEDGKKFRYPLSEIEQHLVEDTPSQYEVGMTVHDYEFGEGKIKSIDKNHERLQVCVKFDEHGTFYYKVKGQLGHDPITSPPRLSLTPYDLVNGGATFPTFKPELPEIEKGALVCVRYGSSVNWEIRFFSHFENEKMHCFYNQKKEGDTSPWNEYSLTNPLINEKER